MTGINNFSPRLPFNALRGSKITPKPNGVSDEQTTENKQGTGQASNGDSQGANPQNPLLGMEIIGNLNGIPIKPSPTVQTFGNTIVKEDGTVITSKTTITTYPDGSKDIQEVMTEKRPDGTVIKTHTSIQTKPNGDEKRSVETLTTNPDGSESKRREETTTTIQEDGTKVVNNKVWRDDEFYSEDNTIYYPDGHTESSGRHNPSAIEDIVNNATQSDVMPLTSMSMDELKTRIEELLHENEDDPKGIRFNDSQQMPLEELLKNLDIEITLPDDLAAVEMSTEELLEKVYTKLQEVLYGMEKGEEGIFDMCKQMSIEELLNALNINAQPADGCTQPAEDETGTKINDQNPNVAPANGEPQPFNPNVAPADGGIQPANGEPQPFNPNVAPADGGTQPAEPQPFVGNRNPNVAPADGIKVREFQPRRMVR